jgi:hypothetical protein
MGSVGQGQWVTNVNNCALIGLEVDKICLLQ